MAKLNNESYISQQEKMADHYDRKGRKEWAKAKTGGSDEGFRYQKARDDFDRAKRARERADEARKTGRH